MTTKADFTPDEWNALLAGPMLAGMAVTIAEPSGLFGMLQEGWASAKSMLGAKSDPGASQLAKAIAEDFTASEGRHAAQAYVKSQLTGKSAAELKPQIIGALGTIAGILDAKAGTEAASVKAWLAQTAENVAEASKEGGFLGFGGVTVSDSEKASLAEVAKALRA
jgi:hypothetical protein